MEVSVYNLIKKLNESLNNLMDLLLMLKAFAVSVA